MTAKPKPPIRIPESQRHTVQLKLRVAPDVVTALDALCKVGPDEFVTRSGVVSGLIEAATRKKRKR